MLTAEENARLTQTGPGTPMGELMRRYWQPIAASTQLDEYPVKEVKILGEELVLYRDRGGTLGLIDHRCAHRRLRMLYGIPEEKGLRCPYHGWLYDETGQCLEMPCEPVDSTFPSRVRMKAYPVQELGGLIFAYMGPQPAPLLPRWDLFVWDNVLRDIGIHVVPCNWLQMMENNVDLAHTQWLHGYYSNYVLEQLGRPDLQRIPGPPPRMTYTFEQYEHGLLKYRRPEGAPPSEATALGFLFPNIERVMCNFQYRVPVDDTHTLQIYYSAYPQPPGETVTQDKIPWYDVPLSWEADGFPIWEEMDSNGGQDNLALAGQGAIADRTLEKLGTSDDGVIIYRDLLMRQMKIVEDGGEPINVFRDPAKNVCIDVPWTTAASPWEGVRNPLLRRVNAAFKHSPIVKLMVETQLGKDALAGPVH